jgi:hypothetical protein
MQAAPLPGNDLSLIDELPHAPGLLAHAPDDLREQLAAAFGLQAIYRHDTRQATLIPLEGAETGVHSVAGGGSGRAVT